MWVRVLNLTFNFLRPPWVERIAAQTGEVIKIDTGAKGYAWGEYLRVRVWVQVDEPLMRVVKIDHIKKVDGERRKFEEFYELQYENLPYFCFSCGKLGHSDIFCPMPASRDEDGRLPSWGSTSTQSRGMPFYGSGRGGSMNDAVPSEGVNSPNKTGGSVQNGVHQFGGGSGRGNGWVADRGGRDGGRGRGRNQVYRRLPTTTTESTLMILDQETLNKKRLNEVTADSVDSDGGSRDVKKKKAHGEELSENSAAAGDQPRRSQ
jgi:hypothetical protein